MKKLIVLSVLTLSALAQAQEQDAITPLRDLRNQARGVIKEFELTDMKIEAGAPEYKSVRKQLNSLIKDQTDNLETELMKINKSLSPDYSMIVALKKKPSDAATKNTIKIASERLESKASEFESGYRYKLQSLIFLNEGRKNLLQKCLSVLCAEKVAFDIEAWTKLAKKLNKTLDLEVTKLKGIKNVTKSHKLAKRDLENDKNDISKYLPVAISLEQHNEALALEAAKVAEAQRLKDEQEAKEKALEAEKQAQIAHAERTKQERLEKTKRRGNQPYGCEELTDIKPNDIFGCHNPYKLINGIKSQVNDLSQGVYEKICNAHGLVTPKVKVPWIETGYEGFMQKSSGLYTTFITCDDAAYDSLSRLNYKKIMLADETVVFEGLTIQTRDRNVLAGQYMSTTLCNLLGYNSSSNESISIYGYVATLETNGFSRVIHGYGGISRFKCSK